MKKVLLAVFLFIIVATAAATPIVVKSITSDSRQLQMRNQYVNASLYRDVIYVECIYNIQNNGLATTANISIPYFKLSFSNRYLFNLADLNKVDVWVNRYKIPRNNMALNPEFRNLVTNRKVKELEKYEQKNKPMLTWQINFEPQESIQITIRYAFALNQTSSQSLAYYSLGSTWQKRIEESVITYSLKNLSKELVSKTSTGFNYLPASRSYVWTKQNYKPSDKSALSIHFDVYKRVEAKVKDNNSYYLNDKKISAKKANSMHKKEVAYYTQENKIIKLYSRTFVINKFLKNVEERYPELKNEFKDKNQEIVLFVDRKAYRGSKAYIQLEQLKLSDIQNIKTTRADTYLEINITLGKHQSFKI